MTTNTKNEMIILRGLPASGKSTLAHKLVSENPDWTVRLSRNDIRYSLYKKYHHTEVSRHQADTVVHLQAAQAQNALGAKLSVIIDDTENLKSETVKYWYNIADKQGVPVRVLDLETSLQDCLIRDNTRLHVAGVDDIHDWYKRFYKKGKLPKVPKHEVGAPLGRAYTPNPDLPKAVWLDIDGTVARMIDRPPFAWDRVHEDAPISHVIEAVLALQKDGYKIVVMSGRDEVCKPETDLWLRKHGIVADDLFMRPANSYTPDDLVKHDLFWEHVAPKYDVRFALDDRDKVVKFTREVLKIPVFQVAPGAF